jgi:hypothetical protein
MTPESDELLSEGEEQRLRELLLSAFAPGEIDPRRHERLLQAALEDPFAPPSPEEIVESERLRRALDGDGDSDSVDAALARALAAAHAPAALRKAVAVPAAPAKGKVIYVAFGGLGAALAAAAALLLLVTPRESHDASAQLEAVALVQSRSTAALFQADAAGDPSSRIDRIASARGRDLRDNRYALWGVK